jgi:N6-adenosine-specific RNA methylase IME4
VNVYRTIVADPPWPFVWHGKAGGRRANDTKLGYETMPYGAIKDLAVEELADVDATLLMWVTQEALHEGYASLVARAWGFPDRVGEFIWRKPNFGTGAYPRIGHETCVIYRRGKGSLRPDAPRNVHSVQTWAQNYGKGNGGKQHSAKPEGFYDVVEQGYAGPFVELFARRARFGWDYWGDQSLGTAEVAA